jgi:hypothetical protein
MHLIIWKCEITKEENQSAKFEAEKLLGKGSTDYGSTRGVL